MHNLNLLLSLLLSPSSLKISAIATPWVFSSHLDQYPAQPLSRHRCSSTSSNNRKNGRKYSTKGAEEIIRVAGWEIWTRRLGTTGEGMGKMERERFRYSVGWKRRWRVCEDTNLKRGVMLWVTVTSLFFLSYRVTDGLLLCKRPTGCLMGNTW